MKSKLCSIFHAICTALCVLTGAIAVPLLFHPFYWMHIKPLQLEAASGLTVPEIKEAYRQMMDYCLGLQDTFSVGILPFSEEGASHFADVRLLFLLDLRVLVCSAAALLLLRLYCRYKAVEYHRFMGHGPAFWSCASLAVSFAALGGLAALDFDRFFTLFHAVFFPGKDNWIFHPRLDPVILILPQEFFRNCAVLILMVLLITCTILIIRDKQHK